MVVMRSHNVPALRLEGFDGEWEIANLGELTAIGGSGGTPSSGNPEYYGGDIPFLAIADIEQRVVRRTAKTLTEKGLAASAAWLVPKGSLTLAMYASVGRVAIVGVQLATSQAFYNMTFSDQALRDFIYARLNRMEELDEWKPYISTGTQQNLNAEKVTTLRLSIPSTLEEQQAIGAIFTNLDAAINQHTKKHQALQQAKIALMQRMFPQECQTVPELRLEGFDGAWKLIRLDTFDIKTGPFGSTLHAKDYVSVGTPIVTTEHFKSGQLPNTGDDIPQVSKRDAARLSMYALNEGDIVFSRVGSVDINARVTQCQKGWLFSGRVLRLRLDASCDAAFLHSALETEQVRTSIISRAVGQTMPSINTKILGATEVAIPPTLEEQQAIGAVFTRLDTLIATEAKYIESLKQAKSALLQRMFI